MISTAVDTRFAARNANRYRRTLAPARLPMIALTIAMFVGGFVAANAFAMPIFMLLTAGSVVTGVIAARRVFHPLYATHHFAWVGVIGAERLPDSNAWLFDGAVYGKRLKWASVKAASELVRLLTADPPEQPRSPHEAFAFEMSDDELPSGFDGDVTLIPAFIEMEWVVPDKPASGMLSRLLPFPFSILAAGAASGISQANGSWYLNDIRPIPGRYWNDEQFRHAAVAAGAP